MATVSDFPSNSKTQTPADLARPAAAPKLPKPKVDEPKVVTPVVEENAAVKRKKPLGRKFADVFTGEEARGVGQYILFDVVVPGIKNLLFDTVTQGLERRMFGSVNRSVAGRKGGFTSYQMMHATSQVARAAAPAVSQQIGRAREAHDFGEIVLPSRGVAEQVIFGMQGLLEQYEMVSVADMFGLCGLGSQASFQDDKWGWFDLSTATTRRTRDGGYVLDLPRPVPLAS